LGWECGVEKGKHKVSNTIIYFEVDSLISREFWSENTDNRIID